MDKYQQYYPLVGMESLVESDLDTLFPQCKNWGRQNPSSIMSEDIADDLRSWLKDPAFSQEQRKPLELDEHQRRIATTRTETGYRRVKGPAGSGKSLVLAARAAELARDGKRVLVCTYNITLMNYLRDLVARHARDLAARQGTRPKVIRQQIELFNFHYWFGAPRIFFCPPSDSLFPLGKPERYGQRPPGKQIPGTHRGGPTRDRARRDSPTPPRRAFPIEEGHLLKLFRLRMLKPTFSFFSRRGR